MQLQHVNVKLLLANPDELDLEPLVPVFHSWIQNQVAEELLLDVADYRHVYSGPGVMLIGLEANYSVDNTDNRPGVRYNRKAAVEGSNQDRLRQAALAALTACERLEADPRLDGKIRFNGRDIEIFVNDRLLVPNNDSTREAAKPDLDAFIQKLFADGDYSLSMNGSDSRSLFAVSVKSVQPFSVADLLHNLRS
jgi:hypothetical protein